MENIIEIKNVSKKYENFTLGPINIKIPKGEIIGLIGENGAGKTTLIKAILNIIKVEGKIEIAPTISENVGVVLDNSFFPEILSPLDINKIMANTYKTWDENLYFEYLNNFNIPLKSSLKKMSKGMRKKTEIVCALAHHPHLLILDEPTSGLDPVVRSEVLDFFMEFLQDEENSIIFSTHITSDLEHIADEIIFLDKGKIILNESCNNILENFGLLKCSKEEFNKITKENIVTYKKNRYNYEVLIANKNNFKKKYKDMVVDKITLEDLMVLMIKGENK